MLTWKQGDYLIIFEFSKMKAMRLHKGLLCLVFFWGKIVPWIFFSKIVLCIFIEGNCTIVLCSSSKHYIFFLNSTSNTALVIWPTKFSQSKYQVNYPFTPWTKGKAYGPCE